MHEHLNSYSKILANLQNLDVDIAEEDKTLYLLNFLLNSSKHLTTTWLYGKTFIKYDDVVNALTNNECREMDK